MALAVIITVVSFFVSFYTCKLIVDATGDDPDYADTLKKYYGKYLLSFLIQFFSGKWGYYSGLICPCILIFGAVVVYFVIMTQVIYPMLLAIYAWCSGNNPTMINHPAFDQFSSAYCGLALFPIQVLICSVKDLKVFMRVGSFGVVFVIFLIFFICAVGT
jgi:hypothetical protein